MQLSNEFSLNGYDLNVHCLVLKPCGDIYEMKEYAKANMRAKGGDKILVTISVV